MNQYNHVLIRRAEPADEKSLLQIIQSSQSPAFFWPDDMFRTELSQTITWVLEQDGQVGAFVCVRDVSEAYELSVLATSVPRQRQGLMTKLLERMVSLLGQERHLWLEVHENNLNARKLYEKLGFVMSGSRSGYYSDGSAALLYTRFHS